MRLDQYLSENFGFTKNKSQQIISNWLVKISWEIISKKSFQVFWKEKIEILEDKRISYVSRSAEKLEKFLIWKNIEISWKICLDIWASTWWFSQILLENWAEKIFAVDVWKNQLHEKIRNN